MDLREVTWVVQKKFLGFFLVFISALFLIVQTGQAPVQSFITWPFLLFAIAAILVFIGFIKENAQLVLISGLAGAIGLFIWGFKNIDGWPSHWSILMIFFGVAVLLQYFLSRHNLSILVAVILILSGFCAWPGLSQYAAFAPIAPTLNTYWPIFFLLLGLYFLLRK